MTSVPHSGAKSVTPGGSVAGGHTAGPWVIRRDIDGLTILGGPNNEAIWCIAGYLPGGTGEMEANARLIAAAPELLAAAIKSHEPYESLSESDIRTLYGVGEAELALSLRAAITKATAGETRDAEPIHRRDGDEG
jgi:hypothetical protein